MKTVFPRARQELTLVPLADMLTNVVGIAIFILIFTVLAAGGAVVAKRLPYERATSARPVFVLCAADRVYLLDSGPAEKLIERVGQPGSSSNRDNWIKRFNGERIESSGVAVTGKAQMVAKTFGPFTLVRLQVSVTYTPLAAGGESIADVAGAGSRLLAHFRALDRDRFFVRFLVSADGIEAFNAARARAESVGLRSGWSPTDEGSAVTFSLTRGPDPGQPGKDNIL
ncbi:hypothetical protein [Accumulibacter sp.]|uniref:hypothetical protein n=1 Tax=Accumulibacter sp. TaxID=2053492 RepID=UPI0025FA6E81|nr:hypothetical protein [Accumulibacter sp.]MCM8595570.1 hypothetical protein [Accumulibacter sp.]MCM8625059.1 hypothetical protein [Accumulibacter sp.]MDS4049718.1 hypothetical protein [Accumulibacter sp.]